MNCHPSQRGRTQTEPPEGAVLALAQGATLGLRYARLPIAALFLAATLLGQVPSTSYKVETVPGPRGIKHEVASIDFAPDGKLYAAFRRGYIYSFDPKSDTWRKFAEGLHTPLGIMAGEKNEFFVAQVPELTRVVDTDDDGTADLFETITDGSSFPTIDIKTSEVFARYLRWSVTTFTGITLAKINIELILKN